MAHCPHCQQNGVGTIRKWLSSPAFPARCRLCDGLSHVAAGRTADILLLATLLLIASGFAAALLKSAWPLLAGGLGSLALYVRRWQRTSLLPTDQASTEQAQSRNAVINLFALILFSLWR